MTERIDHGEMSDGSTSLYRTPSAGTKLRWLGPPWSRRDRAMIPITRRFPRRNRHLHRKFHRFRVSISREFRVGPRRVVKDRNEALGICHVVSGAEVFSTRYCGCFAGQPTRGHLGLGKSGSHSTRQVSTFRSCCLNGRWKRPNIATSILFRVHRGRPRWSDHITSRDDGW